MQNYNRIALLWTIGCILGLSLNVFNYNGWVIYSIIIIFLCVITNIMIGPRDYLFYMVFFIFIQFGIKPILLISAPIGSPYLDMESIRLLSEWNIVLQFQLYSFASFIIFYSLVRKTDKEHFKVLHSIPSSLFFTIVYLIIIGAKTAYLIGFDNSIVSRLAGFSPFVIAGLTLLILKNNNNRIKIKKIYLLLIIVLTVEILWCILIEAKLPLLLDILAIVFTVFFIRRTSIKKVFFIIPVFVIYFVGFIQKYRSPLIYGDMSFLEAGTTNLIGRSDNFNTAVRIFDMTPDIIPFWGDKMIKVLSQTLILPLPFPGKREIQVGQVVGDYYYGYYDLNVFKGLGLATSWYVTTGFIWSIIIMGLMGFLISLLINKFSASNSWWVFSMYLFFVISFANIEQSYFDILNTFQKNLILISIMIILWNLLLKPQKIDSMDAQNRSVRNYNEKILN